MQYSAAAVLALVATASAWSNSSIVYTTEVHTAYTTVCPASTQLTFNGVTYTATASTTLTITNCPCTIVKPVSTQSVVAPPSASAAPPAVSASASAPVYSNTTMATTAPAAAPTSPAASASAPPTTPSQVPASSGNKVFALSGASLAGLVGLAAYLL